MAYSTLVSIFTTSFSGFLHDIFGRKKTIFVSFHLLVLFHMTTAYNAPSLDLLYLSRILTAISFFTISSQPLLNDYVEPDSRGKGVSYMSMSIIFAEIISMGILF